MTPETFSRNGHDMEIQAFHAQGGSVEELFLWCHTCDPGGNGIPGGTIGLQALGRPVAPTLREAALQLRKLAFQHSKERP